MESLLTLEGLMRHRAIATMLDRSGRIQLCAEMHAILARRQLSPNVTRLDVLAPRIAQIRQPGQFVIVRLQENAERIPLTIADADANAGSICKLAAQFCSFKCK